MPSTAPRRFGRALLSFLAFPIGGGLAHLAVGPVDAALPALAGGLLTGAAVGAAQATSSSRRLPLLGWSLATAGGLAVGLAAGAATVDYSTSLGALAAMGAVSGVGVGVAQAAALRTTTGRRLGWLAAQPALWALGWTVTSLVGVDVEQRYVVFGASGALVLTAGFALALERLGSAASTSSGAGSAPGPVTDGPASWLQRNAGPAETPDSMLAS